MFALQLLEILHGGPLTNRAANIALSPGAIDGGSTVRAGQAVLGLLRQYVGSVEVVQSV